MSAGLLIDIATLFRVSDFNCIFKCTKMIHSLRLHHCDMYPYIHVCALTNSCSIDKIRLSLKPTEQVYYDRIYALLDPQAVGTVSAKAAKELLLKSKLPKEDLKEVLSAQDLIKLCVCGG